MREKMLIYVSILSAILSVNMMAPLIGLYTAVVLGAGPFAVGLVYGALTLTSFVFRVPSAWMSSRLGFRNTMAIGLVSNTSGSIVYGMASTVEHMILGSLLRGVGLAFFFPTALSVIYEKGGGEEGNAKGLGYMLTAPVVGMMLGPLVGAGVLSMAGYQAVFFSAAAISSAGMLSILSTGDHAEGVIGGRVTASISDKRFLSLLASRFFISYIVGTVSAFLPLMAKIILNYDEPVILLLFSAGALANLSSRVFMGVAAEKLGVHNYILIGSVTLSAAAFLFSLLNNTSTWAGILLYGAGMGVFILGSVYMTGHILPQESRAMGFSLLTLMTDFGNFAGNFISGIVLSFGGFVEVFAVAALSGSVGAMLEVFSRRWPLPSEKHGQASAG